MLCRQLLSIAVAAGAVVALSGSASAQLGEQPVKIVFPFAAGGIGDALTRMMGEKLSTAIGKPVIVENRAGGAGRPGVQAVKSAAADGRTILMTPIAPMSVYPHYYKKLGYDTVADFEPLSQIATFEFAVAIAGRVPAKTLKELVAWVKANPKEGNFGSPAVGTLPFLLGLKFAKIAGVDIRHVSYRGSAAALQDLVSGQLPMEFTSTGDFVAQHKAGKIRVLATSEKQMFLPDVPTFREAGYDLTGNGWYAMYAPAKTSPAILEQYSKALAAAVKDPTVAKRIVSWGMQPTGTTRAELAGIQKKDLELWGPIVKDSGFVPKQ
jgi:tripartite-type tricarboxylate transporter receptor subunit TctC